MRRGCIGSASSVCSVLQFIGPVHDAATLSKPKIPVAYPRIVWKNVPNGCKCVGGYSLTLLGFGHDKTPR